MKGLKALEKVEEYVTYFFFASAILVSLYGVFMRYVLNKPQFGLLEIIEILMPWAIFIGFGRALKENHHIAVDVVYDMFPFLVKRVIAAIANLCGSFYSFYLAVTGVKMIAISKKNGFVTTADSIPMWIEYVVLPIGMGLLGFYFLWKAYLAIIGNKDEINGVVHQEHESYLAEEKEGGASS
ncbi:MAG TPA: TRAP transporter small permease [Bacillales bacterium]|nr:TRAP transporter small permease [Bacillales bacterium]